MTTFIWNQDPTTPITVTSNGDWRIRLAAIHRDVVFPAAQRRELSESIMRLFVAWVISGTHYQLSHDDDPPWDHSGTVVEVASTERTRLTLCATLGEWMDRVLTGAATPTYLSGAGLAHDTYADEVDQLVLDWVAGVLEPQIPADAREAVVYDDEFAEAVCALHDAILASVVAVSAGEAYRRCGDEVRRALAVHATQAAARQAGERELGERATRFWARHLPCLLTERRLDERAWQRLHLAARLRQALADADPADVAAVAAAGLPGCPCTPSVSAAARAIAAEVQGQYRDFPCDLGEL